MTALIEMRYYIKYNVFIRNIFFVFVTLKGHTMDNRGVTIIELLIVIVVMGIIAAFSLVKVSEIVKNTKIKVDTFNLSTLNEVTEDYSSQYGLNNSDAFFGISTNPERMQELVSKGYLDSTIKVQQDGASFQWDVDDQLWDLIGGELTDFYDGTTVNYSFDTNEITDLTDEGTVSIDIDKWTTEEGYLENTTGETRIFIPMNASTYTISVSAALGVGNSGGYGIFFDITLKDENPNKEEGYVFQFDRGFGEMVIRKRLNTSEGHSPVIRFKPSETTFPSKTDDPGWWRDTHSIQIIVTNLNENERYAEFIIDGVNIGSYTYANKIGGEKIYTGFRGWGSSSTQFYSITAG